MQIDCGGHILNIMSILFIQQCSYKADITRAIYYGLGCANNPDVDDYYDRAHGFPIVYSPDEDPEVIEEMKIAEAELQGGGGTEEVEDSEPEGSSEDLTSDGSDGKDNWVDADEIEGDDTSGVEQPEKQKRKRKLLSCVEKVHTY